MTAFVPVMFALIISMNVVGAIDLDELYKRAADVGKPPPPPPPIDPEMSAWSTDALMGMNSDTGMGSVFEEMQKRHAHHGHKKAPAKKGPHHPAPQVVQEEAPQPKPKVQAPKAVAKKTARKIKQNLVNKARAKAAQEKSRLARKREREVRRHAEAVARKADHSASKATMLTTHVFTETAKPRRASGHPHMLTANVFGNREQHTAPKKRVVKKKAPKKVKKARKPKVHHEEHIHVDLPHAAQRRPSSPLDILNDDPERSHDASGASLTGLASQMLTESDNAEKEQKAAAAKQAHAKAKSHGMNKKKVQERLKKDGIHAGPTLNLDVDDSHEEELPDEKKLPPLDAFLPMDGGDDDGF